MNYDFEVLEVTQRKNHIRKQKGLSLLFDTFVYEINEESKICTPKTGIDRFRWFDLADYGKN